MPQEQEQPRPGVVNVPAQEIAAEEALTGEQAGERRIGTDSEAEHAMHRIQIRAPRPGGISFEMVDLSRRVLGNYTASAMVLDEVTEEDLDASIDNLVTTPAPTGAAVQAPSTLETLATLATPEPPIAQPPRSDPHVTCPECESDLRELRYSCATAGREYGSASIMSDGIGDHEMDDSSTDDSEDYTYSCPECSHSMTEEWVEENLQGVVIAPVPPRVWNNNAPRPIDPLQFLRGHYGPVGGAKFHSQLTEDQRKLAEERKPEEGASEIVTPRRTGDEENADNMMLNTIECPECTTLFNLPNARRFDWQDGNRRHGNETIQQIYQACPNCGFEINLKEQRNH